MDSQLDPELFQEEGMEKPICLNDLAYLLGIRTKMGIEALRLALSNVRLLDRKQQDYGSRNISDFGAFGVLVRANDKIQRLRNLMTSTNSTPNNEPLVDSWRDLGNYGLIGQLIEEGKWE